jgi:hypothetical protein
MDFNNSRRFMRFPCNKEPIIDHTVQPRVL